MTTGEVRGRAARSAEKERFWRRQVAGQAASGLSIRKWCRRERLSEPSFYAWRRELARRDRSPRSATTVREVATTTAQASTPVSQAAAQTCRPQSAGFLPVQLAAASGQVELEFASGLLIRVPSENTAALRAILEFAEAKPC